jgi:hypothetical protein
MRTMAVTERGGQHIVDIDPNRDHDGVEIPLTFDEIVQLEEILANHIFKVEESGKPHVPANGTTSG